MAIADLVKTTLGPKGMVRLYFQISLDILKRSSKKLFLVQVFLHAQQHSAT